MEGRLAVIWKSSTSGHWPSRIDFSMAKFAVQKLYLFFRHSTEKACRIIGEMFAESNVAPDFLVEKKSASAKITFLVDCQNSEN